VKVEVDVGFTLERTPTREWGSSEGGIFNVVAQEPRQQPLLTNKQPPRIAECWLIERQRDSLILETFLKPDHGPQKLAD